MVAAMAESDTALVVVVGLGIVGLLGLFGLCIAYLANQAAQGREPAETVVYVKRTAEGYVIVEKEEPTQRGTRFVVI